MKLTHDVDQLPPRLQRYKMRLTWFNVKVVHHIQGKCHYTADTLSRKVANNTMATSTIPEEGMNAHIDSIIAVIPASDPKLWGVENV